MAAFDVTTLDASWKLSSQDAAVPLVGHPTTPLFGPGGPSQHAIRLENPSTLALALVGVGMLAMFRAVKSRVAPVRHAVRAPERPIKPRRRVA